MISQGRTTNYAWCQEGARIRLSFDPTGTVEAVCRKGFPVNQILTGDEELFSDFDTEAVAQSYVIEMMKAAILQLRMTMLDGVTHAAEISSLERKLIMVMGNKQVVGSMTREKKNMEALLEQRNGIGFVPRSPYLRSNSTTSDYGGNC